MRKLLVTSAIAAATIGLSAAPALAGNSYQIPVAPVQDMGPAPACLDNGAELLFNVDTGHNHAVTNNNGDWENSTVQGTWYTDDGAWSGHGELWFGFAGNNNNLVEHFKGDGQLTDANGDKVMIFAEGQFTLNGAGGVSVLRNIDPNTGTPLVISCK